MAVCDLGDFYVGEAALVEHFADFGERQGGVERVGEEGALEGTPRRGVGFD